MNFNLKYFFGGVGFFGLIFVLSPVFIGVMTFDGLAVDKPYERGIRYDEIQRRKSRLGLSIALQREALKVGPCVFHVSLKDKNGNPVSPTGLNFRITRPSTRQYDRSFTGRKTGPGEFDAPVEFPLFGLWDVEFDVDDGQGTLPFQERVFVNEPSKAVKQGNSWEKDLGNLHILFDINPKPLKALKELSFRVTIKDPAPKAAPATVSIDLSMPGMFMGKNLVSLREMAPGIYEGTGVVTKCRSGRKIWQAEVRIERPENIATAAFIFEVE